VVYRPSRLRALAELGANAQSSAEALDRIGRVACRVLDVPVALVNLIGADRQRFVGCGGPEPWASMREMPLTAGFCPFALGAEDAYALEDARTDPVHASNLAVRQYGVVAYAGVPLRTAEGEAIGTLCALDSEPRAWSPEDLALLSDLAAAVIAELQLLTATRIVARDEARLRSLAELTRSLGPTHSAGEVLEEVGRRVDELDAQAVWLSLVDGTGEILRTAAATGGTPDAQAPAPPAGIARVGDPDFLTSRTEVRDRYPELLEAMPGIGSAAVLPLSAGEERLGVLGIGFAGERPLSNADRGYLAALGGVSALALARGPLSRPTH